ncbi:hypothetical protein [Streptacidiphilus anmyonensis]|uniref:hypothetical protein n=1 Tax=Streptacidiphilus anmyonensis TaxID=405782 RepID=UPI000693ECB6|nr:hypothetical protein [Streptacidiphilus anmyonensis]
MYGPASDPTPPYTPPYTSPYTPPYTPPADPYAPAYGYPPPGAGPYTAQANAAPYPHGVRLGYDHLAAPRERSTAARVGLFLLRVLLTCVPIASIGILAWVPLVRAALLRRRVVDWVVLAATVVLCTLGFYLVGSSPDDRDTGRSDVGVMILLLMMASSTVYYLVAELRQPRHQPVPPYAAPAPSWSPAGPPGVAGPAGVLGPAGVVGPEVVLGPVDSAAPAAQPTPIVPLGQVQADLDELSALLHQHERPAR